MTGNAQRNRPGGLDCAFDLGPELPAVPVDADLVITAKCREAQHSSCTGKRGCECYCHRQISFPGMEER